MPSFGVNRNITLSKDDVEELELFVPDITAVSISATAKKGVTGGDLEEETQYTIAGVTESYQEVSNLTMAIGEFITEENDTNQDKVCVLGSSIAEEIFGSAMEAFDSIIYIDGRSYTVYGVLERMGTVSSGISPDEAIFVPYDTAEKYIMGRDISPQITVVAKMSTMSLMSLRTSRSCWSKLHQRQLHHHCAGKQNGAATSPPTPWQCCWWQWPVSSLSLAVLVL